MLREFSALLICASVLLPIASAEPSIDDLEPGATLRLWQAGADLSEITEPAPGTTPNVDRKLNSIDLNTGEFGLDDRFVGEITAWLRVDRGGQHDFRLTSDDGSVLIINGERVVLNGGVHAPVAVDGSAELTQGLHALRLLYFEAGGGESLRLEWRPPGANEMSAIPPGSLLTESGVTRVVSPGVKQMMNGSAVLRPGDGLPLESLHPGWRLQTIRPDWFEPMVGCMLPLPDGRLMIGTFEPKNNGFRLTEPNGTLWILSNLDAADRNDIEVEKVSEDWYHPLGMCMVDGAVYIAQRDEITKLEDRDGDGMFESRSTLASGWISDNYHHFTFGLVHREGYLYATLATAINAGDDQILSGEMRGYNGPNPPNRGTLLKIDIETGAVEYIAGGLRTPNGIAVLTGGEILVGENQGAWMSANKINHVQPGRFYGHYNETRVRTTRYPFGGIPSLHSDRPIEPPALWLPQNEIANSPTSILVIEDGPFAGQIYIGDVKAGGIRRAHLDRVDGVLQGAVFRSCQGFEGGINRLAYGPDGSIFVGCIGERWTWSWRNTRFGLQRLVPTGEQVFEFHRVEATADGFVLNLTGPADRAGLADPASYSIRQWTYRPEPEYGGEKVNDEPLAVERAEASGDGRSVRLVVPGLRTGQCVYIRADLTSEAGQAIWSPEAWYTLNHIPGKRPHDDASDDADRRPRVLVFSRTAGFRHASIPDGVRCIEELGADHAFEVQATEQAWMFNDDDLARFDVVVFLNTTGDVLNLAEEAAFRRWFEDGGGFVGIHSAADTEHDWPWYGRLVGAYFRSHPPGVHRAAIDVADRTHRSTRHLPPRWTRTDEWYDFGSLPPEDAHTLLRLDESTYTGGRMGVVHPIAWTQEIEHGRAAYSAIGHTSETFDEPDVRGHLVGLIEWAAGTD